MRRIAFHFLAAISTFACIAVAALWIHGYLYSDHIRYARGSVAIWINSQAGRFRLDWTGQWPGQSFGLVTDCRPLTSVNRDSRWLLDGFDRVWGSFAFVHRDVGVNRPSS